MDQTIIVRRFCNKLLQSCSYIIEGSFLLLVDPGEPRPLIEFINNSNKVIKAILLTHCHFDHIYGLGEILRFFPSIPIYCSISAKNGLFDSKQNLSFLYPDYPLCIPYSIVVQDIKEGEYLINGNKIIVFETPGHSDDCLTYVVGNYIFTGDSYIPFSKVFAKWPSSRKDLAERNERKLIEIINQNKYIVLPGHWQ